MADEEKKNSSAAESILAETAELYEDEVKAEETVEETAEKAEEVKAEAKEEKKAEKNPAKKTKKKASSETAEVSKEPKEEPKNDIIEALVAEDVEETVEEVKEEPALPAKSEAVLAIEAKEAAKLARKNEREQQQAAKRNAKRARLQALIDQCPNEYKPVSTSKFFWYGVLCNLPGLGFIITLLFSIFPVNKNVKNFARSILIVYIIGIILWLIGAIILFFMTPNENKNDIVEGINKIIGSFG
ncbi:MAG: hypothetical protein J6Z43_02735 [Clostridiales bacterium]|nr:hypothetical protein [Clostridiales bacterium]